MPRRKQNVRLGRQLEFTVKKVFYLGYFSDIDKEKNRRGFPSADTKMQYVMDAMTKEGYDVEVLSFCGNDKRDCVWKKDDGYESTAGNVRVRFFSSYRSRFRILRIWGRQLAWMDAKRYIRQHVCQPDCSVLIYHSPVFYKVTKLLRKHGKSFIYEAEEIYSDVTGNQKARKKELAQLKQAAGYMFSTAMLSRLVNTQHKPEIIVNGTYQTEPDRQVRLFDGGSEAPRTIHCVYAGTLDVNKGGGLFAASAAACLSESYHIHILGFGSPEKVAAFQKSIAPIQQTAKARLTYDGVLQGEAYVRFLQSCDIGLSTQNPDAAFNDTSFPSKILSYMANGLRVVSVRIPVIEQSAIGGWMDYYDRPEPQAIANAIVSAARHEAYDSRKVLEKLDAAFRRDLHKIFP